MILCQILKERYLFDLGQTSETSFFGPAIFFHRVNTGGELLSVCLSIYIIDTKSKGCHIKRRENYTFLTGI